MFLSSSDKELYVGYPYVYQYIDTTLIFLISIVICGGQLWMVQLSARESKNNKCGINYNYFFNHSHLSNKRGVWNKCGGGAKNAKSLNAEG